MNNKFYEGPIQTGKSTLIREFLRETYGRQLKGVAGFTSQRVIDSEGRLLGFCLAPANAEISAASPDGEFFKKFGPDGVEVCMDVFENAGVRFLDEAFAKAKSGEARIILLDEIGGELMHNAVLMLNFKWPLDVWGGKRADYLVALGRAHASEIEAQAARLALAANIARSYIALAQAFDSLDIADQERTRSEKDAIKRT